APAIDPAPQPVAPLPINRRWDVLKRPRNETAQRAALAQAAKAWGDDTVVRLAGVELTAALLEELAKTPTEEPLLRAVRERMRRPIDLEDFLYFLDDVLRAPSEARARGLWVSGGRARSEGILLHTDDIYKKRPRRYATRKKELSVDKPARPDQLPPAADGDPLGPNWSARFENPSNREGLMEVLRAVAPEFLGRVMNLLEQLERQGAEVYLTSTVRKRERGFLMWGSFYLSRSTDDAQLLARSKELEKLNRDWKLNIPIQWQHPNGVAATREAARQMSDAYDVVYATRRGARYSDHYDGDAVDFVAIGLPRTLTLEAPDGAKKTFDLSHPTQPRDISLTPGLVRWIETHFALKKLRSDYPHWNDTKGDS
ncbi:MAG: hypothetical protein AAF658_18030, partial [Myxococcota bacterium]